MAYINFSSNCSAVVHVDSCCAPRLSVPYGVYVHNNTNSTRKLSTEKKGTLSAHQRQDVSLMPPSAVSPTDIFGPVSPIVPPLVTHQVMVTNVTSLLKTVKAVEDEATRGTRALEATIECIKQELTVSSHL